MNNPKKREISSSSCLMCGKVTKDLNPTSNMCEALCHVFQQKFVNQSLKKAKQKKTLSKSSPSIMVTTHEKVIDSNEQFKQEENQDHQLSMLSLSKYQEYPIYSSETDITEKRHKYFVYDNFHICKVVDGFDNLLMFHNHQYEQRIDNGLVTFHDLPIKNTRIFYCLSKDSKFCDNCTKFLELQTHPNISHGIKPKPCIHYKRL